MFQSCMQESKKKYKIYKGRVIHQPKFYNFYKAHSKKKINIVIKIVVYKRGRTHYIQSEKKNIK